MLQSYVGIISQCGLEVFCSENRHTVQFLRRRAARNPNHRVCFWSVVPDEAVQLIHAALEEERFGEALSLVHQHSREYGFLSLMESEVPVPIYL